jgi:hypothetical protein
VILAGPGLLVVVLAAVCATGATFDVGAVHYKPGPEGVSRNVVLAILAAIGAALMVFGLRASRTDLTGVPAKTIKIDDDGVHVINPPPQAKYRLSGQVTPKQAGITVWLVRERLDQQEGFRPSPHTTTTTNKGRWEQTINLWPGRFRIHAVVTTGQNENVYRMYESSRDHALSLYQEKSPGALDIPGWPHFDSLLEPCLSASCVIEVV